MNRATALATLAQGKHRITRSREAILDAMLKLGARRPFSAADLFGALASRRGADLVTIYRNLEVFEAAGLICRTELNQDTVHFTLAHAGHDHHHHHVVCRKCRKVAAVNDCGLKAFEASLHAMGFADLEHRLEFTGTCRTCRRV